MLRGYDELSFLEIGELLGISENTATVSLRAGAAEAEKPPGNTSPGRVAHEPLRCPRPARAKRCLPSLLAELDQAPPARRPAIVDRYLRENPGHESAIRELIDADQGVSAAARV